MLGPERNSLSPAMLKRCDYFIKIPARFALNVGIAGVIVMYDRLISQGRFAERPLLPGGPKAPKPPKFPALDPYRTDPPLAEIELTERDGAKT